MNTEPLMDRFVYLAGGTCCCFSFILFAIIVWMLIEKRKR